MNTYTTYKEWRRQVDVWIIRMCGLSGDDLPDYRYRDAYHDEVTPKECAQDVIEYAKTF